jgi:hypothetical protein
VGPPTPRTPHRRFPTPPPWNPQAILYYFHRTSRCHTCLTVEANIDEALQTYCPEQLKDDHLLWHPTNIEDLRLESNAAILVRPARGARTSWVELEEVWSVVWRKGEFLEYVREEVAPVLKGGSASTDSVETR